MSILVQSEIQKAVANCNPVKIAVAYIGADWSTFIPSPQSLEAVILSPTFGTNPSAVIDLVRTIGWEKVFFLDSLHAKVYLGNSSAVVGSANLTNNGLSGCKLVELCVELSDKKSLFKLDQFFTDLLDEAKKHYPTIEKKKERLKELDRTWGASVANGIIQSNQIQKPIFADFELLGNDHFYVIWYQPFDYEYSDDVKAIQFLMADEIHFSKNDKVKKNKWALVWRNTNSNKPHPSAKPHWLYIHEIIEDGVIKKDYEYTKCVFQRNDLKVPPPPFELTPDIISAFKKSIQENEVAEYLIQENQDRFSLLYSLDGLPLLLKKMRETMAKNT